MQNGEKRRQEIINMLKSSNEPVPGSEFAKIFNVSRQIVVSDIALLRASGFSVFSTNKGYTLIEGKSKKRVFAVHHSNDQIEDELNTIVDAGGRVIDVYVNHKIYGEFRAPLDISSRLNVTEFVKLVASEKISPLKQLTNEYHYHTIEAASDEILDIIEQELRKKNYLV